MFNLLEKYSKGNFRIEEKDDEEEINRSGGEIFEILKKYENK